MKGVKVEDGPVGGLTVPDFRAQRWPSPHVRMFETALKHRSGVNLNPASRDVEWSVHVLTACLNMCIRPRVGEVDGGGSRYLGARRQVAGRRRERHAR